MSRGNVDCSSLSEIMTRAQRGVADLMLNPRLPLLTSPCIVRSYPCCLCRLVWIYCPTLALGSTYSFYRSVTLTQRVKADAAAERGAKRSRVTPSKEHRRLLEPRARRYKYALHHVVMASVVIPTTCRPSSLERFFSGKCQMIYLY